MKIVLFEDEATADLAPLALTRPAFDLLCGGQRLVELVQQVDRKYRCVVRPHLRDLADADFARAPRDSLPGDKPTLFVNARLVPSSSVADLLPELLAAGPSGKVRVGPHTALAVTRTHTTEDLSQPDKLAAWLDAVPDATLDAPVSLFTWPHDVVARHLEITGDNLERRVGGGAYREEREGVFLGPDARLGPHVVTDTQAGPIVLESGVTVGAHAYLRGPLYLAANVTVIEHASLKGPVVAGCHSKLGGEITASIIDSYSNKGHHGFLGHSYVGSWVNLGAGTTTSNLKNSYGEIAVEYQGRKVASGMQFLGCLTGDCARTAINTAIFSGKTMGVASTVYGTVTVNVPSFVNYAGGLGQSTEVAPDVAVTVQARMLARRGRKLRDCDASLLRSVYDLTSDARRRWDPELDQGPPVFR